MTAHGPASHHATGHPLRLLAGWAGTGASTDLEQHIARHGPAPLARRPGRNADPSLIAAVEDAGLTGRGGAGFPTGRKLRAVAQRGRAVVVANGMESEPLSAKDRALLLLSPHLVLDGIVLAARAVGATTAHLCLARPRTHQIRAVRQALADRARHGLDHIQVQVHELPHHYVSSEESALTSWLDGGPARPRSVPPRPFEKGVGGRPTLIDNVETLAHLALIARHGPAWFRGAGSAEAPGTHLLTLAGAVHRPGVYELPGGRTIGEALAHGGGCPEPVQAVLVGGYSGAWLPAGPAVRTNLTTGALAPWGASPGAGVLAALPSRSCGLAETAHVLDFLARSSARQCGPCRFGLPAVAEDFAALAAGRCDEHQAARLRERVALAAGRGACRHPDGASRLAASALRVFAADADRHLRVGPCAGAQEQQLLLHTPRTTITSDGWR